MAAIKRFFEKRKLDIKFRKAGDGQKLASDSSSQSSSNMIAIERKQASPQFPATPSVEQKMAADAALARLNQPKPGEMTICRYLCIAIAFRDIREGR